LAEPGAVKSAVTEYRADEDIMRNFLDECCVVADSDSVKVSRKELWGVYTQWHKENGLRHQMTKNGFSREIQRLGIEEDAGRRFWLGVGIREDSGA